MPQWRERYPDCSISTLYRKAVDDDRETIYVRVDPEVKRMLWDIAMDLGLSLSGSITELIECEFEALGINEGVD